MHWKNFYYSAKQTDNGHKPKVISQKDALNGPWELKIPQWRRFTTHLTLWDIDQMKPLSATVVLDMEWKKKEPK